MRIRQHTSAYVAYVCIRQHCVVGLDCVVRVLRLYICAYVSIRQHTSHTSAYVCIALSGVAASCEFFAYIYAHTSAYVSIRLHTSAYVCVRQHTSAYAPVRSARCASTSAIFAMFRACIRQHTSAYVSIRRNKSAYVSIRQRCASTSAIFADISVYRYTSPRCPDISVYRPISLYIGIPAQPRRRAAPIFQRFLSGAPTLPAHAPSAAARMLHTQPAYVSIRQHTSLQRSLRMPRAQQHACYAHIASIRQHTSAYVSIRQHTSAYVSIRRSSAPCACPERTLADVC
jgi:hypothetical protein